MKNESCMAGHEKFAVCSHLRAFLYPLASVHPGRAMTGPSQPKGADIGSSPVLPNRKATDGTEGASTH